MVDCKGREVQTAGPASPVSVFGLRGEENLGEDGLVVSDEQEARSVMNFRNDTSAYSTIWDENGRARRSREKAASAPTYDKGNQITRGMRMGGARGEGRSSWAMGEGSLDPVEDDERGTELSIVLRDTQGSLRHFLTISLCWRILFK